MPIFIPMYHTKDKCGSGLVSVKVWLIIREALIPAITRTRGGSNRYTLEYIDNVSSSVVEDEMHFIMTWKINPVNETSFI